MYDSKKLRVAILYGGRSAEHEISILSARNIHAALDRTKYEPILIGIDKAGRWLPQRDIKLLTVERELESTSMVPSTSKTLVPFFSKETIGSVSDIDVVFPVLHGPMGEDGTVQGLLELADVPYVGAGVLGSAVGMDKDVMKRLLKQAGIPVARWFSFTRHDFDTAPQAVCTKQQ
jgi:D-alanine-D-alanine ligase